MIIPVRCFTCGKVVRVVAFDRGRSLRVVVRILHFFAGCFFYYYVFFVKSRERAAKIAM